MMVYGIPNTSECPQPGTAAYDISTTEDVWKYERVYHFFFHSGMSPTPVPLSGFSLLRS
jgi:hypothetical protein